MLRKFHQTKASIDTFVQLWSIPPETKLVTLRLHPLQSFDNRLKESARGSRIRLNNITRRVVANRIPDLHLGESK
jgi:hypothetical protein